MVFFSDCRPFSFFFFVNKVFFLGLNNPIASIPEPKKTASNTTPEKGRVSDIKLTKFENGKVKNPARPAARALSSDTVKLQKYVKATNWPIPKNTPPTKMKVNLRIMFETNKRKRVNIERAKEHLKIVRILSNLLMRKLLDNNVMTIIKLKDAKAIL